MGPEWLKLLSALPKLLLYAVGQFALYMVPVFLLLAVLVRVLARWLESRSARLPSAGAFVVMALIAAVPATIFVLAEPQALRRFAGLPEPMPAGSVAQALKPPVGGKWPEDSRYLALPQQAQGGAGSIRVQGGNLRVYLKLCAAGEATCPGLRHAILQRRDVFEFQNLAAGRYELRYLPIDLPSIGGRTQAIEVGAEPMRTLTITDSLALGSTAEFSGIRPQDF